MYMSCSVCMLYTVVILLQFYTVQLNTDTFTRTCTGSMNLPHHLVECLMQRWSEWTRHAAQRGLMNRLRLFNEIMPAITT